MVTTADLLEVPPRGHLRLELLSVNTDVEQGVDLRMEGGCVLADGAVVPLLRTMRDPRFEDVVEYDYRADTGEIWTWNVYPSYPGMQPPIEKWTENAGMWTEKVGELDRIYHCSQGFSYPPDFDNLVYRLTVSP